LQPTGLDDVVGVAESEKIPGPRRAEASRTRMRSSRSAHACAVITLPSLEPLSATTISHGASTRWATSASSCSSSHGNPSRTGRTTLIIG
jgi:hypothetical protein